MPTNFSAPAGDSLSTSSQLIRRLHAGEADAWRETTSLYGPLVYHWLRRFGFDGADAADLFQEVFLAVSRHIHRFDPGPATGTFRGWLWTITRRKALDAFRSRADRVAAAGGTAMQMKLAEVADPFTEHSDDDTDRTEASSLFHRGLAMIQAEFEPRTWQAFWRAVVDGQDTATIASELKLSPASVRQAKSRVLRRLRQMLGDH